MSDVQRRHRLWAPAYAFSLIGLVGVVTASQPEFRLRGGLLTNGLYVLALQLVVSALALSAIDDLRDPRLTGPGTGRRWWAKGATQVDGPFRLRRALWHFYLWLPMPAGLLACGLSMSLSLVAIGTLDGDPGVVVGDVVGSAVDGLTIRRSELALGVILVLTVLLTLARRDFGRYGWVVGLATGAVATQLALDPYIVFGWTVATWALLSAVLLSFFAIHTLARRLLSRRRRREPA